MPSLLLSFLAFLITVTSSLNPFLVLPLTLTNCLFPPCPFPSSQFLSKCFPTFFLSSLFSLIKRIVCSFSSTVKHRFDPSINENNSLLIFVILLCSSCASSSCPSSHGDSLLNGIPPATFAASLSSIYLNYTTSILCLR